MAGLGGSSIYKFLRDLLSHAVVSPAGRIAWAIAITYDYRLPTSRRSSSQSMNVGFDEGPDNRRGFGWNTVRRGWKCGGTLGLRHPIGCVRHDIKYAGHLSCSTIPRYLAGTSGGLEDCHRTVRTEFAELKLDS